MRGSELDDPSRFRPRARLRLPRWPKALAFAPADQAPQPPQPPQASQAVQGVQAPQAPQGVQTPAQAATANPAAQASDAAVGPDGVPGKSSAGTPAADDQVSPSGTVAAAAAIPAPAAPLPPLLAVSDQSGAVYLFDARSWDQVYGVRVRNFYGSFKGAWPVRPQPNNPSLASHGHPR